MRRGISFFLGVGLLSAAVVAPVSNLYIGNAYAEGEIQVGDSDELVGEEVTVSTTEAFLEKVSFGGMITLGGNIELGNMVTILKDTVIDLNGNEISSTGVVFNVDGVKLTVKDGRGGGKITSSATEAKGIISVDQETGEFVLESGTIEATNKDSELYGVYALNGGTARIKGGEIVTHYGACLSGNNTTGDMNLYVEGGTLTSDIQTIYMPGQVNLVVSGGTLNGGILARMGQIKISDGTIRTAAKQTDSVKEYYMYSGLPWLPDAIAVMAGTYSSKNESGNALNLEISGGTIISTTEEGRAVAVYDMKYLAQEINVEVKGGTFESKAEKDIEAITVEEIVGEGVAPKTYGKNGKEYTLVDNKVKESLAISGGYFSAEPSEDEIEEGYEADYSSAINAWTIEPKVANRQALGDSNGLISFDEGWSADRKASAEIYTDYDGEDFEKVGLNAQKGGKLVKLFDITLNDRNGSEIEVKDTKMTIKVKLSDEEYEALSEYDKVEVVYIEDDAEKERMAAELKNDETSQFGKYLEFETDHLSQYGAVGVNVASGTSETEEETTDVKTANTGRLTREEQGGTERSILAKIVAVIFGSFGIFMIRFGVREELRRRALEK